MVLIVEINHVLPPLFSIVKVYHSSLLHKHLLLHLAEIMILSNDTSIMIGYYYDLTYEYSFMYNNL